MKFSSVPAWSFGGRRPYANKKAGDPGPGHYNAKNSKFRKGGFSLGRAERKGALDGNNNPVGPGQYNYNYTSFGNKGASIKGKYKRQKK